MAEKKEDSWFGLWLNAAKNKSTEVLEFVQKDLEEFGTAASSVVSSTGNAIGKTLKFDEPDSTAGTMKRSISSFLGQITEVLNPSPDDSDTEAMIITEDSETQILTKAQQAVYNLQRNEDTYLQDPNENATIAIQFQCWLEIFNEELTNDRISKMLLRSTELREKYTKLVPDNISNELFWKRYLFRKALIEDEIAREEESEKKKAKEKDITEENLEWEKEDFANDIILTEEEQLRILEQYDNEIKDKRIKQTNPKQKKKSEKTTTKEQKKSLPEKEEIPTDAKVIVAETVPSKEKQVKASSTDSTNTSTPENVSSNSSTDGDWEKLPKTMP